MKAQSNKNEMIGLVCRYVSATFVMILMAALVSILGVTVFGIGIKQFLSGAILIGVTVQRAIGSSSIAFAAALVGVFLGSYCLPQRSRSFACVTLTIIVSLYYQTFWYVYWRHEVTSSHGNMTLLVPLAGGGMCACLIAALIARRKKCERKKGDSSPDRRS